VQEGPLLCEASEAPKGRAPGVRPQLCEGLPGNPKRRPSQGEVLVCARAMLCEALCTRAKAVQGIGEETGDIQ
jgi:hypothetical protein